MHERGDIARERRTPDRPLEGRQQLGHGVDRLHDAVHRLALIAAVFFDEIVPIGELLHGHERLDLPLSQRRMQRQKPPDVIQRGQQVIVGKGIGDLRGDMVIVEPEHLHRLVASHKVRDAVFHQLGIEEQVCERRTGAGIARQFIEPAIDAL